MSQDRFGIVGKLIARTYEIRDVVAEGGFGVVYRAYHRGFRAEVALKCLKIPSELTEAQRRAFLEQFRGEAEVLFRLSAHSPNIVRPLHIDAFQTPEAPLVPFMALEWLEGRTLDALIVQRRQRGRPPLALSKLARLLTPVAAALEQAHNLPGKDGPQVVVHRDMKPENLFIARVGAQDVAKVLDFGISKVKSTASQMAGRASLNADAFVSFSPAYGAPEQWAPRRFGQTGRWTDVWGLALTVVEAAKGDEVIQGDHAAMMGTILDPMRRPTPRNEGLEVPDDVERVFARALAVDPRQRYQSVGEFWDTLTAALGLHDELGPVSLRRSSSARNTSNLDSLAPSDGRSDLTPALAAPKPAKFPPGSKLAPTPAPPPAASSGPRAESSARHHSPAAPTRPLLQDPPQIHAEPFIQGPMHVSSQQLIPTTGSSSHVTRLTKAYDDPTTVSGYPRRSVWKELSPAFSLMALSVAVTVLDRAVAYTKGVPLTVGPVHASWIAGGCMIIAIGMVVSVLKRAMDD